MRSTIAFGLALVALLVVYATHVVAQQIEDATNRIAMETRR